MGKHNKINRVPKNGESTSQNLIRSDDMISESLKEHLIQLQSKKPDVVTMIMRNLSDAMDALSTVDDIPYDFHELVLSDVIVNYYTGSDRFMKDIGILTKLQSEKLEKISLANDVEHYMLSILCFNGQLMTDSMYNHARFISTVMATTDGKMIKHSFIETSREMQHNMTEIK